MVMFPAIYLGVLLGLLVMLFFAGKGVTLTDSGLVVDFLPVVACFLWPVVLAGAAIVLPIIGIVAVAFGIAWVLRDLQRRIDEVGQPNQSDPLIDQ